MAWLMRGCCKKCGLNNCGLSCWGKGGNNANGGNSRQGGSGGNSGKKPVSSMSNLLCFAVTATDTIPNVEDVINAEDLIPLPKEEDEYDGSAAGGLACLKGVTCNKGDEPIPKKRPRKSSPNEVQLRSHTRGSRRCILAECGEHPQELRPRGSKCSQKSNASAASKKVAKKRSSCEALQTKTSETSGFKKMPLKSAMKAFSCPAPCLKDQVSVPERNAKSLDIDEDGGRRSKSKKAKASPKARKGAKRRAVKRVKAAKKTAKRGRKGGNRGKAVKRRAKRRQKNVAKRAKGRARAPRAARGRSRSRRSPVSPTSATVQSKAKTSILKNPSSEAMNAINEATIAACVSGRSPSPKREPSPPPREPQKSISDHGSKNLCAKMPWMRSCGKGHVA